MNRISHSIATGLIAALILIAAIYPLSCREATFPEVLLEQGTMLDKHNLIRESTNRSLFAYDHRLSELAKKHSEEMARQGRLFHSRLQPGQGENVAAGTNLTDTKAVKLWWKSPGHRANMLGNYSLMGYGSATKGNTVYWTVIFEK